MRTFPMMVVSAGMLLALSGCGISQEERAASGGLGGAAAGALVAGPVGAVVGGAAGAAAGSTLDEGVDKKVAEATDDRNRSGRTADNRRTSGAGGMSREEIRSLQQALNDNGQRVAVDGVWGQETRNALREYQQSHGLEATGRPDQRTLSALNVDTHQNTGAGSTGTSQRTMDGRSDVNRNDVNRTDVNRNAPPPRQ